MTEEPLEPSAPLEPHERYPFWSYSDLLLFAGLAIPSMLLGFGVVKAAILLFRLHDPPRVFEILASQFAGYGLLFVALLGILRLQYDRPFWRSLAWIEPRFPYLGLIACGLLTALGVAFLALLIRTPTGTNPMVELLKDRPSIIAVAIFGVTIGPLFEELAFRGFLQPLLVRSWGPLRGILGAAVPFGLLHFQEYGNSWKHVVVISLAGAMFGWMRQKTGSTKASTVMHASYNALFFVAVLAQGKEAGHV